MFWIESGVVVLAKIYREYLLTERGVSPLKERMAANPVLDYAVKAMRVKIFHAQKKRVVDGSGELMVYADFKQTEAILDYLQEVGIKRAVITLVGWNLGGHDGAYPTRFPVEPELGGQDGLLTLISKAKALGYQIVPHDNVTDVYRPAPDYDPEYVTRTRQGEPQVVGIWAGGQSFKACPVVYYDRYGSEVNRIRELGFAGSYYLDAQASVLWTCHDPRHPADEEQYAVSLARMTQLPRALYGAVSVEMGPVHTLPFVDELARIHGAEEMEGMAHLLPKPFLALIDRVVPFYQIAIHGLVVYQNNWVHAYREEGARRGLLYELAVGARPSMEISYTGGANGDPYQESVAEIKEFYQLAFDELPDIHAEFIDAYEELSATCVRIRYSNGTVVTSNWGTTEVENLAPMSYAIQKGLARPSAATKRVEEKGVASGN